jgi:molybdopterin-guanine dinucleotide biosynthesis protein A
VTSGEPASRCAILIGGAGERIGGDKHLRELAGRPLAWWVMNAGRQAHLEPLFVAKSGMPLGSLLGEAEVEIEAQPERHPLIGVIAALELTGEPLVVTPCDVPLIPGALLRALAEAREPTVVAGPAGVEPLLGRYEPGMLPLLHEAVGSGSSARTLVTEAGATRLEGAALAAFGDPAAFLRNVNTQDDLLELGRELSVPPR